MTERIIRPLDPTATMRNICPIMSGPVFVHNGHQAAITSYCQPCIGKACVCFTAATDVDGKREIDNAGKCEYLKAIILKDG